MREARIEAEQERRRKRDGGELTGQRLGVPKSSLEFDKYTYRWVNDLANGRMYAMTQEDDWEVVPKDKATATADMGNAVSQIVGTAPDGSALRAYLCRKPRKFYDDDQKMKSEELDRQLAEMRRGNDRNGGRQADYIPNEGIRL